MESLPHLITKSYENIRHEIRSGDILLCSGNSIFSNLIKQATGSHWSHVAFVLRVDAIDRIMVLESVESIGVRTVPLSHYVRNYNNTGKGYDGQMLIARHAHLQQKNIPNLSRAAVDLLGQPYRTEEIVHIATRLGRHRFGIPVEAPDNETNRAFICSEYAQICFKSIGIHINHNPMGFIAPSDFIENQDVEALFYLGTENLTEHNEKAA